MKMKRIIFSNALLATVWAEDVLLEIDDAGIISAITPYYNGGDGERIQGYALPAVNNIHSHAFQRAMAGLAEYSTSPVDSFWTWRDIMYRFATNITADDLKAIASRLYMEMLMAGYGTVSEFHYLHDTINGNSEQMSDVIMEAADEVGIGLCHLPVLYMTSGFGGKEPHENQRRFCHGLDDYLELLNRLNSKMAGRKNQHLGMAFHSLRAVPQDALQECLANSPTQGPIHIHISEQQQEVDDCLKWSGARPVEWLYDHVDVDDRWCLIHATNLNDNEVKLIANSGAVVGLCPTTEANLGDGLFPLKQFFGHGGNIAIGSDSHISVSVVEELRLLEYGQRLHHRCRNIGAAKDEIHTGSNLYKQCLYGGAKASGFNNGVIAVGKKADIIILDENSPLLVATPVNNVIDRFIFNGNQNPIKHVMVGGDFIIKDYQHKLQQSINSDFFAAMKRLGKYID